MPMLNLNPALKTCHYNDKLGSMLLPAGRMQYPALFEPQAMKGEFGRERQVSDLDHVPA